MPSSKVKGEEPGALLAWLQRLLNLRNVEASLRVLTLFLSPVSLATLGNPQAPPFLLRSSKGHIAGLLASTVEFPPTTQLRSPQQLQQQQVLQQQLLQQQRRFWLLTNGYERPS